ncbi:MAG: tetratricopeptide repeat protein [Candidatus Cyclobacteriaceae bacterium M2_1C_046]
MKNLPIILVLFLIVFSLNSCENKKPKAKVNLKDLDLLMGEITLCGSGEFGDVSFALSCKSDVRQAFDLAISLLHSFEYDEAEKAFVKVLEADPECAMAYWGVAMSNFHSLWLQSGNEHLEKGAKVLKAASLVSNGERENDYINALAGFYNNWEKLSHTERVQNYEQEMYKVYQKYNDDEEAAIFYALALLATADPADKTYRVQRKSGAILESIYPNQPNHPGIAHYIIHNYDYPELAELALPTARKYAQIAPSSAHAQHMPSHIFTRLGLWNESISSNIKSTASALCYSESIDPDAHWDEELHGMDYLVYAYLQTGNNQKANEQHEYLKTFKKVFPANFKVAYTAAAIPARIALENKNWEAASKLGMPTLELDWNIVPWQESILFFTRAMGNVRQGNIPATQKELDKLIANRNKLIQAEDLYKANQVQIQIKTIEAWIAFANGKIDVAVILMREAAEMEYNTNKHPVTPGEVLPAGELLGDLLLAANQPAQALKAYEYDLKQHPNRFNGIYGAASAASRSGDEKLAKKYFGQLIELTTNSGTDRKEVIEAKEFMSAKVE